MIVTDLLGMVWQGMVWFGMELTFICDYREEIVTMARLTKETVSNIANEMELMLHHGIFQTAGGHKIARLERRTGYMLTNRNNLAVCGADNGFAFTASLQEVIDFLRYWDPETFNDVLNRKTID